jgi:hypothetical protein
MKKRPNSETKQSEKFIKLARQLECDESEEAFDEKMKKILTVKPPPEKKRNQDD